MSLVYINGRFVKRDVALISASDRGLLYGEGLIETVGLYNYRPFDLDAHLERLRSSADFLGIRVPDDDIETVITKLAKADGHERGAARITLTSGVSPKGPRPGPSNSLTLLITTRSLPSGIKHKRHDGVAGETLEWPLRAAGLPLQAHKTTSYLASTLAFSRVPTGVEPLLENTDGKLVEGATTNIFAVKDGIVHTPPLSAGCLPGVARATIIELCRELEIELLEADFDREFLCGCDEAFLTNSVIEIFPLIQLNGDKIGSGGPGLLTRRLQNGYMKLTTKFMGQL